MDSRWVGAQLLVRPSRELYQRTLGSATDVVVHESPNPLYLGDWSRDGKFLLYHNVQAIFALPRLEPRPPLTLIESRYVKDEPHFHPTHSGSRTTPTKAVRVKCTWRRFRDSTKDDRSR